MGITERCAFEIPETAGFGTPGSVKKEDAYASSGADQKVIKDLLGTKDSHNIVILLFFLSYFHSLRE